MDAGAGLHWRARLAEQGLEVGLIYTGEVFTLAHGGVQGGTEHLHDVISFLALDLDRLLGLSHTSIYVSGLGNAGGSPTSLVGDYQVVSNIDAPDTWKVYEAYVALDVLDGRLAGLAGLYDLNSEFDVIESAGLFINSSFGIGPEYAQSGRNGPSVFPTTGLALRLDGRPSRSWVIRAAVLEGVPGDPDHPFGTQLCIDRHEGLLLALECNRTAWYAGRGKLGLGAWLYTSRFEHVFDLGSGPGLRSRNRGVYALAECPVWIAADASRRGGLFVRLGTAHETVNRLGSYVGAGLTLDGYLSRRFANTLGLGIASAQNSSDYRRLLAAQGTPVSRAETVVEFTARLGLSGSVMLQPDLQIVLNPNTDPTTEDAVLLGLRLRVAL